ncbi:MAG TPA: SusD/RagB family nutrient-binding outer membrane lipoprotein [Flavobacterium sp.]|jgi:hypothetical protein|nr:SusD/RagB family nutrient-binding outer membrane lipoprotein [Flavobacterium sp.]
MKKIKFILPIIALSLFSCSDYLDINESPNSPTKEQVTPDLALSTAQTVPFRTISRTGLVFGNLMLNNWGYNVNSFAVTSPEEFTLAFTNNTYSAIWDGLFIGTANLTNIINHPSTAHDNHKAIAKIMKSYYFQYLVDMYGDIPYSEAHLGSESLTPSYDDDQAIYRDLVVQIEEAIAMINNPAANTIAVGGEDSVLNGDMNAWIQFGNTLKMRLLLRQSEMTDGETQAYLTAEFAELAGADFLDADVTINPGYDDSVDEGQNPIYNLFYEVQSGSNPPVDKQSFRLYRASEYFAMELEDNPKDPRRTRLFNPVGGMIVGVRQGDASAVGGGTAPANISTIGPGVIRTASSPGFIMTLAESKLLHAEAALRGYLPGDAQTLFNEGIIASFNHLQVANPGTYVADIDATVGKGLGGGTFDDKIEAIMYQKNVALSGHNALEVYIEYTRTGVIDNIPLVSAVATQPNRPRRLLYPNSEYVGNSANVPQQSVNDIFTSGPFWFVEQ